MGLIANVAIYYNISRGEFVKAMLKRISEKLLMGWKMLKAVCPITNECPLLEDKNGRQWSAALNMYVDEYKEVEDVPNDETPPLQSNITQPSKSLPSVPPEFELDPLPLLSSVAAKLA